jgi:isoamylase
MIEGNLRPRRLQAACGTFDQREFQRADWDISYRGQELIRFTQELIALRHKHPILRRTPFLTGEQNEKLSAMDVSWSNANGSEMALAD